MPTLTRRRIYYAFGMAAAVATAAALTWVVRTRFRIVPVRSVRPSLDLSETRVNFGRLKPLAEVERKIAIHNRGGGPLELGEPVASCGCQKPELARRSLGPGESTELVLRQQAPRESGAFSHMITISSNDPESPSTTISIFGEVTRGVVIRPEPLVFEPLAPGETQKRVLEISSDEGKAFELTHCEASGCASAKVVLNHLRAVHHVEVTLRAPNEYGPFREQLFVMSNVAGNPPFAIPVLGEVRGPTRVSPSALILGNVQGFTEVSRKLILRSTTNAPLTLPGVKTMTAGWVLHHRTIPRNDQRNLLEVELRIRVPNAPGVVNTDLQIEVEPESGRGAGRETFIVPVSAVVRGSEQGSPSSTERASGS